MAMLVDLPPTERWRLHNVLLIRQLTVQDGGSTEMSNVLFRGSFSFSRLYRTLELRCPD